MWRSPLSACRLAHALFAPGGSQGSGRAQNATSGLTRGVTAPGFPRFSLEAVSLDGHDCERNRDGQNATMQNMEFSFWTTVCVDGSTIT
jgi:hypothetical protein